MNKLLVMVVCLLLSACASTAKQDYIRATGSGANFEEAKNAAFREAIQRKAGTIVLSERESSFEKLLQDDIGVHSAGYVEEFNVISNATRNGRVYVTVDVIVSSSKLANFKLGANKTATTTIDAPKVSAQYNTYIKQAESGDGLLNRVLSGYPNNAFVLTPKPHRMEVDQYRNFVFVIPYEVKWNINFLKSFNEAMAILSKPGTFPIYGNANVLTVYKNPRDFFVTKRNYRFDDTMSTKLVFAKMDGMNKLRVRVTLLNRRGEVMHTGCQELEKFLYSASNPKDIVFDGNAVEDTGFVLTYKADQKHIVDQFGSVKLTFDTFNGCLTK